MKISEKPLVSIGMPLYNGNRYIKQSIQAILHQSHANLELIISDDSSEDNSFQILQEFTIKDTRIKLFQHKHLGSIQNFNFVLEKASGEYFIWAAQDDIHHQDFVESLLSLMLQDATVSLVMSDYRNLHTNKTYKIYEPPLFKIAACNESLEYYLKTHNLSLFYGMFRTKILKHIGGYHVDFRPYFKSSDFLTIYKTLLAGKLGFVHRVLFYKRDTGFYTNEYSNLKQKPMSILTTHIVRYALFPVHYIFDFMYGTMYLLCSGLRLDQKIQAQVWLLICTARLFGRYIIKSLQGTFIVLKRILKL
ncbi:MAG: Glycosyl transferase [Candidatus Roizmanbacteria bacterium GW2011_GWA2_37_7]|uniref:Glycosyl transferase n=1 Tax=Candidatus Roizmanbacteria bacterium GW2011_GWA2_37_7 TaxID=1618481 RepID=A0A0G0KDC8_9BACT|nr:MAG: Glycosyl transferase [Candidatus Roizmanbacteria bacterium GW2011_GWA2_37_7]